MKFFLGSGSGVVFFIKLMVAWYKMVDVVKINLSEKIEIYFRGIIQQIIGDGFHMCGQGKGEVKNDSWIFILRKWVEDGTI